MANNSGELKVGQLVEAGVPFSIADALTTHHRDNGPVTDIEGITRLLDCLFTRAEPGRRTLDNNACGAARLGFVPLDVTLLQVSMELLN